MPPERIFNWIIAVAVTIALLWFVLHTLAQR
jgi:hypothetical protein